MTHLRASVLLLALAGCEAPPGDPLDPERAVDEECRRGLPREPFPLCIEDWSPAPDTSFGHDAMPAIVLGPPQGDGGQGSTDVASLGCGGQITLYFGADGIPNVPGPDFTIFENPFVLGAETFVEPARVLVSAAGRDWLPFPCDRGGRWPPTGCAGIEPVYATPENGWATDPAQSGGDSFDLDEFGVEAVSYVRIVDVTAEYYDSEMWCGSAGGFDLDAIAVLGTPPA